MSTFPALSVLVVNYNTAALTQRCVTSLRAQGLCRAEGAEGIEIIVVDNASRPAERQALAGLEAMVVYNDDNRGYGAALNQAAARAGGDFLLFSNSDTWYFPGTLQTLLDGFLALPRCGAVGPRLWWDYNQEFLLPPSDPVTLSGYLQEETARLWPWWQRQWARRWLRRALYYWRVQQPLAQRMLSGACILTRREVLTACGGFDEGFHLYYEDTDWCRRVEQEGYRLYSVPEAQVAHLYNQSARQHAAAVEQTFADSAARYFSKHYGAHPWRWISSATHSLHAYFPPRERATGYTPLGMLVDPPQCAVPAVGPGECLLLLSPVPSCVPAIARFLPAPAVTLPLPVWEQMGSGNFYLQLLSLPDLHPRGKWCWEKVAASSDP